jgi:ATP diphosphatase
MNKPADQSDPLTRLLAIMAQLRSRDGGCPWDIEQTFATIAPYTIEEAYEVADAIEKQDWDGLKDELGDLLFQVVFHSQMASEENRFDFADVAGSISDKMVQRHPHVFGDQSGIDDADKQTVNWEVQKAAERHEKAKAAGHELSALDGVASGLPALMRATKLQKRAARVGFDWPDAEHVIADVDEELGELKHEIGAGGEHDRLEDELGDVLFTVVNLARHLGVDPEAALRCTNAKFERRFRYVEDRLAEEGRTTEQADLEEMDAHWNAAKGHEHGK